MTFATFCKIFNLWITVFSYWLINIFVYTYNQKDKSNFFIMYGAVVYGVIIGLIICGGMIWFDYHPHFAPSINTSEISSLSLNDFIDDLEVQKQKELEAQKEIEQLKTHNLIWIVTTLVVYYIIFNSI